MGRRTKLTPELQDEICKHVAGASTLKDAATLCDVDPSTVFRWQQKGEAQKRGIYRSFCNAIDRAKAQRRSALKLGIRIHGKKDWRALMALGAITDPEEFVPQVRVHVTSQLDAALDRLKEAFANEPEAYERALHAIVGGAGGHANRGGEEDEGGEDAPGGEGVHAAPAEPKATGLP